MSLMDDFFAENEGVETISTKDTVKISATTITPLLQLDSRGKQRTKFVYEEDKSGSVPFFSANGFRGALRRVAFKQQVEAIKKKNPDFKLDAELYYLYTSGAALDKTSSLMGKYVNFETEKKVRENAPVLSLFGAGLSNLEGKIAVADLSPAKNVEKYRLLEKKNESDSETWVSKLLGHTTLVRADSAIASKTLFDSIIDMEDINRWRNKYYGLVIIAKAAKNLIKKAKTGAVNIEDLRKDLEKLKHNLEKEGDTVLLEQLETIDVEGLFGEIEDILKKGSNDKAKEENSHIQQLIDLEFIIPQVQLTSSINAKYGYELTDVEIGCLISALAELSTMQIGSAKRIGFGVLDWTVEVNGKILLESKSDPDYVLHKNVALSEDGKKYVQVWKKWLEDNAAKIELPKIAEKEGEIKKELI